MKDFKDFEDLKDLTEKELEDLENSAIESALNHGISGNMWHPNYGWIVKDGKPTEVGLKFYKDNLKTKDEK